MDDPAEQMRAAALAVELDLVVAQAVRVARQPRLRHRPERGAAQLLVAEHPLYAGEAVDRVAEIIARDQAARTEVEHEPSRLCRHHVAEIGRDIGLQRLDRVDLGRAYRRSPLFEVDATVDDLATDAERPRVIFRRQRDAEQQRLIVVGDGGGTELAADRLEPRARLQTDVEFAVLRLRGSGCQQGDRRGGGEGDESAHR